MNINYKEYVVSPQAAARARKESLNKDLKNSIRGRENGYVARLGEIAVAQATGGTIKNTILYQLIQKVHPTPLAQLDGSVRMIFIRKPSFGKKGKLISIQKTNLSLKQTVTIWNADI